MNLLGLGVAQMHAFHAYGIGVSSAAVLQAAGGSETAQGAAAGKQPKQQSSKSKAGGSKAGSGDADAYAMYHDFRCGCGLQAKAGGSRHTGSKIVCLFACLKWWQSHSVHSILDSRHTC